MSLLIAEGVTGIPGITGLSFFETFTIMYAPPLIIATAIAFLFIYLAKCKESKGLIGWIRPFPFGVISC